ncbi:MAG: TIGR01777 family oxidoreductase [Sporichthyaceae bacterium]
MKVVVAGSSGLIGSALVASLKTDGHHVVRLVRRPAKAADELQWDPEQPLDPRSLAGVHAAVNLAGAGVGDKRWSEDYKRALIDSRLRTTHTLATAIAGAEHPPSVFVAGSAVGFYGHSDDRELDENSPPGDDFLAQLCVRWEAAAAPAASAGIRVVHPRTGLVVAREGGAWARMFPLFKLGLGGKLGSGKQYWSFISLRDEVAALRYLLERDISGPVNLTAPNPVTNAEVTKAMGAALHRPTLFPAPAFALKVVLGEFASEPLGSQRVLPRRLEKEGFTFADPSIDEAIRAAL